MKPLFVLIGTFVLTLAATRLLGGAANYVLAGNLAMAVMLFFTGLAHFTLTNGMMRMLPSWLPARKAWVYFTGVVELAAAAGLLLPSTRHWVAWPLIVFFIVLLPANIYAAMHHIDYQKGTADGPGPRYLWFRVPLQLLFIAWVWFFGFSS
ncbi:DoxX family protein [Hymenobacter crusticola]|uniref:DoxX family protein n=1 Tax=Hymenobacter crusticola TaxID=1770526 RepID=A0A243WEA1_9BACT|nr:DoxX family protein [Hymenobacter crusticola]OUJ74048.1 hypothetical protein BXP70_09880 [Hymenobacter crusticola]